MRLAVLASSCSACLFSRLIFVASFLIFICRSLFAALVNATRNSLMKVPSSCLSPTLTAMTHKVVFLFYPATQCVSYGVVAANETDAAQVVRNTLEFVLIGSIVKQFTAWVL